MMEIIKASAKNKNDVYALLCELEGTTIDNNLFETMFLQNIENEDIFYLLAIEDHIVLGFASLHIQRLLHHVGNVGEIQEIIVEKKHQGQGIGATLYNKLKQIAIEKRCVLLEVCCNQRRIESHEFYHKQGMKNTHYKFTIPLA